MRVPVVQVDDEAQADLAFLHVVQERAAAGAGTQGPSGGVDDMARTVAFGADVPDLLHAEAELRNIGFLGEAETGDGVLRQRAPGALAEQDVFAPHLHSRFVGRARRSVLAPSELACDHARDLAVRPEHQLGAGHARVNLDFKLLRTLSKPAANVGHRNDVAAVIAHERRHGPVRNADHSGGAQQIEAVVGNFQADRRVRFAPIGKQGVKPRRVEHRSGEDVRADFRALLEHADLECGIDLLEPDRG